MAGYQSRFLRSYYQANAMTLLFYLALRSTFVSNDDLSRSKFNKFEELAKLVRLNRPKFLRKIRKLKERNALQERQSATLLAIALSIKFLRRQSLDGFLAEAFMFCKSVILLISWYMDTRFALLFGLGFIGISIAFPQPFFDGPTKIVDLTPQNFNLLVEKGSKGKAWIVEFFAPWSPQCLALEPAFAEISNEYASDTLQFAKLDVSEWPSMAKKFKIRLNGFSDQLPTIIKFENGIEKARIPFISPNGKVSRGKFRKQDILVALEM